MKPYVICHMCTTIDGKILGERWPQSLNSLDLFESTAATFGIPAWLVGTRTMREFSDRGVPLKKPPRPIERKDHIADPKARRFGIGTDAKGVLRYERGTVNGDHVVLLVSERVTDGYLAHLQAAGVSYLFCGRDQVNVRTALRKLGTTLGLRKVLLEGGGTFNGAVLKAGLVDEISHVVVPVVDGGTGVAGFFDIPGKAPRKSAAALRQIKYQKLPGGVNWFRYRVIR